jgi:hypothetical protein
MYSLIIRHFFYSAPVLPLASRINGILLYFNIQISAFCHTECVHFTHLTQEAVIISRNNIMQSLFILDTRFVYCEVGTELFFIIGMKG